MVSVLDSDGKETVTSCEGAVCERDGLVGVMLVDREINLDFVGGLVVLRVGLPLWTFVAVGPEDEISSDKVNDGVAAEMDEVMDAVIDSESL